jgi:DNA-binding response OmpR family regulator
MVADGVGFGAGGYDVTPLVGVACYDVALAAEIEESLGAVVGLRSYTADWSQLHVVAALVLVEPTLDPLCQKVRAARQLGFCGSVISAALSSDSGDLIRAIRAGADDYVPLPDRETEIPYRTLALVRLQSGTWKAAAQANSTDEATQVRQPSGLTKRTACGVLSLDVDERLIRFGEEAVSLTVRELHLLQYLQAQQDTWISADALMTKVFGYAPHMDNALLRVHVASLRRKLRDQAWRLESRRTFGYRWRS